MIHVPTFDLTDRMPGRGYDRNGNVISVPGFSWLAYDVSNRLASASPYPAGGTKEVYFNSLEGEKLRTHRVNVRGSEFALQMTSASLYFGGKLIWEDSAVVSDRLGSRVRHFPYGVTKFATYYRDASTALDYAQNRYYSSTQGRFLTPDPSEPGNPVFPQSWNYYAYVELY